MASISTRHQDSINEFEKEILSGKKTRLVTFGAITIGIVVLISTGVALKDPMTERWYLWRLQSTDRAVRERAAERLADIGSATFVQQLLETLQQEPGTPSDLSISGQLLVRIGAQSIPGLVQLFNSQDEAVRKVAALALQEIIERGPFRPLLVPVETEWRYLVGAPGETGPPESWNQLDFDDAGWPVGKPGFGFGDNDDTTVLPEDIGAVFLRHKFSVDDPGALTNLVLQANYDDGFVAYLNGERVTEKHYSVDVDGEPTFASLASRAHEARGTDRFDLTARIGLLKQGENILAMVALNRRVTSNDLSLVPELGTIDDVHARSGGAESQ